jgi:GNAT superfamily N-acetyltransferase
VSSRHVVNPRIVVNPRLVAHLERWLGAWPPPAGAVLVVAYEGRDRPGWDGLVHPVLGVASPDGAVLSVPTAIAGGTYPDLASARAAVAGALDRPDARLVHATFRWSDGPADLPDLGQWVERDDPRLPDWLRPFNGGVLVAWDSSGSEGGGEYVAGVGIKCHDQYGQELAVGTEPAARGRGIARRLVATAAREVLRRGAVPTYLHDVANTASAKVADAAGFPDRGWRVLGLSG